MTAAEQDETKIKATEPNPGSAGPVSIEKANQKTLPTIPLAASFPRADLGDSGTRMLHGIIAEEYNPQLQGVQGIKVYDEMRKSDGTVRAAMLVTTLPIRRATWFINPATEAEEDKQVAEFVQNALFEWLDLSWDDIIREALLMLAFGVMLFEKVYTIKEDNGKSYVTLEKLAPRLPKSILQWELPDRTFGIQQIRQDGVLAMIPGSKLLIFVNEREGDNWWGTSMLRAAYKHWYMKNTFYKIDAIAFERQGLGVPMIKMPMGYTESDEKKATQALQNLRASENAYLILPQGYEAEFMNMGARTTRDPNSSIEHHNKEILQSVLAQFLELGATKSGSGSRALSQDHSDLFLKAMEAVADTLVSEFNKNLIKELVDLNFSNITTYPKLAYSGISKVDIESLGTVYGQLVTAGAITPTDDDQQYIRTALGLPPRTQEQIDEMDDAEPAEDPTDPIEPDENEPQDPAAVDKSATKVTKPAPKPSDKKKVDKAATDKKKAHERKPLKRKFDDGQGFMSWRPLTFAEQKVSFSNIEDKMNSLQDEFGNAAAALLVDAKDAYMAKLQTALQDGDQKAIAALSMNFETEYEQLVKDYMKQAYEYGKNNVSTEMGVSVPPNNADSLANIALVAKTIAQKAASDLEAQARLAAASHMTQDSSSYQAAGDIDKELTDAIGDSVDGAASTIVGQGINSGRNDVFERNSGMIYALQRSEILDEKTCDFCLSMDGRVVEQSDSWAKSDIFHSNCRGIWVEILKDEQNPPDIGGIPDNLASYYGGQTNDLVQPRSPIVRPDSPAADEANKRKTAKK